MVNFVLYFQESGLKFETLSIFGCSFSVRFRKILRKLKNVSNIEPTKNNLL